MARRDALSWAEYNAAKFDPKPSHQRGRPDPEVLKRLGQAEPVPTKTVVKAEVEQPIVVEESFMDTMRMAAFKFLKR